MRFDPIFRTPNLFELYESNYAPKLCVAQNNMLGLKNAPAQFRDCFVPTHDVFIKTLFLL